MPTAQAGPVRIEYETLGDRRPEPAAVLLVAGLSDQLVYWPDRFCERLARRGRFVIRYDHRDVGKSSRVEAEYGLDDMAADGIAVLDALGVERVNVVGNSLGGMIAQRLAIVHPEPLATMTLMSTLGDFSMLEMDPEVMGPLMTPPAPGRDGFAEWYLNGMRVGGTPGVDESFIRGIAHASFDRGHDAMGVARQMTAATRAGSWFEDLTSVDVPTFVIHGGADRVVPLGHGEALAAAIPGAELWVLPDRAHDLPWGVEDDVADRIGAFIDRHEGDPRGA